MDENEKRDQWIRTHQPQMRVASALGNIDFDYSLSEPLFLEMMKVQFPNYLNEYLLKNPLKQLDICAVGSGIKPEFLPALREIKTVHPELELNTYCVDHIFWQNEACTLLLSILARELNLPLVDSNISLQIETDWVQYQIDFLTVYLKKFFDENFCLPANAQDVAVTLFHTLNYLDADYVTKFLEDPRVKIICIANGKDRGFPTLFNRNRFTDFFDTHVALRQLGFIPDVHNEDNWQRSFTAIYSR